jgi:hypothetical protein
LRTTAHHPVERFHRTLKAAIMCHAEQNLTEALPLVLLGIRASFKVDLQASVAELVYGEPLRIPGELLTPTADSVDPALCQHMARLRTVPAARHASPATFVHSSTPRLPSHIRAQRSRRVHARLPPPGHNARALELPYSSPYRVLSRREKALQVSCTEGPLPCQLTGSSRPTCSMEPTAGTADSTSQPTQPRPYHHTDTPPVSATRTTRSGRHIHFPARLNI